MLASVLAAIRDYRDRGAVIAVDDWGPGFSNIDRLVLLQPDIVKVDSRPSGPRLRPPPGRHRPDHRLGGRWAAQICAEGVESEEQLERLRHLGVHFGQGFHFGRPRGAEQDADRGRLTLTGRPGCSPTANTGTRA